MVHQAYFYGEDEVLLDRLKRLMASSVSERRNLALFLTRDHKELLEAALQGSDFDLKLVGQQGWLKIFDADQLGAAFSRGGRLNESKFHAMADGLLGSARLQGRSLTVCGEVVSVLWHTGHQQLAVELEEAWDKVVTEHPDLHMYCLYATSADYSDRKSFVGIERFHPSPKRLRLSSARSRVVPVIAAKSPGRPQ